MRATSASPRPLEEEESWHLVLATDAWLGRSILEIEQPFHPIGQAVLSCLHVILEEEWEHHRYAVRDLDAIEAKSEA